MHVLPPTPPAMTADAVSAADDAGYTPEQIKQLAAIGFDPNNPPDSKELALTVALFALGEIDAIAKELARCGHRLRSDRLAKQARAVRAALTTLAR